MLERLRKMRVEARSMVTSFEPGLYTGKQAAEIVELMDEMAKMFTAGKLKAAIRVEETRVYELDGHTGAGPWLAGITGEPVGAAINGLETMKSAIKHPELEEAFKKGEVSQSQVRQIASACEDSPKEVPSLLDAAGEMTFDELKKRCEEVKFSSKSGQEEIDRHERIRRQRSCRTWMDPQGAGHLEAKMAPDAFAVLSQCLGHFERQVLRANPKRDEPRVAYAADALLAMAEASIAERASAEPPSTTPASGTPASTTSASIAPTPDKPTSQNPESGGTRTHPPKFRPLVRIRVDWPALRRGHTLVGETCCIPGIGAVPVEAARSVLGEALLELVITNGTDVTTVVTDSRTIRKALRVALEERDQVCCVPGCGVSDPLEIDHFETDFVDGGLTEISNLARLCSWHHYNKTHKGWRLEGSPGHWKFVCPDDRRGREPPDGDSLF